MEPSLLFPSPPVRLDARERFDWLRLLRCENIGPQTFLRLISRYGSAGAALAALPALVAEGKQGRTIQIAAAGEIEREIEAVERLGGRFIGICEPEYPALLRRIRWAPPMIAVRGQIECFARPGIAIVGARNASAAGLSFAAQLARAIGRAGHVIVSGLARGIDAKAHQAAIESGTVAVLAGGLGKIYPADHELLLERILEMGAAVSEMPFGWEARGRDFPRRNRIIAGLCRAVVVVEAARRSGSLITARFAAEQGREVFAVPGSPLDPRAEGANDLLRDGASFCTKAEDVLDALAREPLLPGGQDTGVSETGHGPFEGDALFWDEMDLLLDLPHDFSGAARRADPPASRSEGARGAKGGNTEREEPAAGPAVQADEDVAVKVGKLLGPVPVPVDELARMAEAPARQVRIALAELSLAGKVEWHAGGLVSSLPPALPRRAQD
ncbi:MAG TPA: DNA-processing protein DprA [Methylocella sp.]|nr:DNA-processing protein DprA [Methylocella sp.]